MMRAIRPNYYHRGTVTKYTGGGDDLDRNELGPNGKSLGFYDPYTGGVPDPTNNIFIPGQNFSSMVNGQMTSFTVNGIPVTQGHFSQMTDTAFGGLFGIMEAQLRSFRIRDYSVRGVGENGRKYERTFKWVGSGLRYCNSPKTIVSTPL